MVTGLPTKIEHFSFIKRKYAKKILIITSIIHVNIYSV